MEKCDRRSVPIMVLSVHNTPTYSVHVAVTVLRIPPEKNMLSVSVTQGDDSAAGAKQSIEFVEE